MVMTTASSSVRLRSLKSVDWEASTVNSLRLPSPLEKVTPLDRRETLAAAATGAFFRSMRAFQERCRYTHAVPAASVKATAADQRAYREASLRFIFLS